MSLDPENDEAFVITQKPVLEGTKKFRDSKQVQPALNLKTLTAQQTAIYSNAELFNFLNIVLPQNTPILH